MANFFEPDAASIGWIRWTGDVQMYVADNPWANAEIKGLFRLFMEGCYGDILDSEWRTNIRTVGEPRMSIFKQLVSMYKLSSGRSICIITKGYGEQARGKEEYCNTTVMFAYERKKAERYSSLLEKLDGEKDAP
tara:strand:+ start:5549 stop:5950 length:402 start_codon:yes stop_codon:yes gene_type:complete